MPLPRKTPQEHRQGILSKLSDLLDNRFAQVRRIAPGVGQCEGDMRMHQMELMRLVLMGRKGFGPIKLCVADILASFDDTKRLALFNPTDQVSLLNEIVPSEEEAGERRAGQLAVRSLKTFYSAIDPSLEPILDLLQTFIWWDLPDAAELYRFDLQLERIEWFKTAELDQEVIDFYRKEMNARPGVEITRSDLIKFELLRAKGIMAAYAKRREADEGHQIIAVSMEHPGNPEADAATIRLAKRLTAIEKVRVKRDHLDDEVKQYYAPQLGIGADDVTGEAILALEESQAAHERQQLFEQLSTGQTMHEAGNYKLMELEAMQYRLEEVCQSFGITSKQLTGQPQTVAHGE